MQNSVNFIIKGGEEVQKLSGLIPREPSVSGITMIQRNVPNLPTILYDSEAKSEVTAEANTAEHEKLVIELSDREAIAINCAKEKEFGLQWTTK